MTTRKTSIHKAAKPRADKSPEIYGAVVSVYRLSHDTEPHVIAGRQRKDVVLAWEMFGDIGNVSEATILPVSLCRRRLIEAGIMKADEKNRYYMPQEATS